MLKKIEDIFAVALVALLSVTALVIKVMQDNLRMQVMDADAIIVNIAFVFACVAGLITWRENRALCLANVTEKFPPKAKAALKSVATFATALIITQLFLASFMQIVNPDQFTNKVMIFVEKFFFAFYPLCFLMILILVFQKAEDKAELAAAIAGTVFGVLTSMSAVTGKLVFLTLSLVPSSSCRLSVVTASRVRASWATPYCTGFSNATPMVSGRTLPGFFS